MDRSPTQQSSPDDAGDDPDGSTDRGQVVLPRPWLLAGDERESREQSVATRG